MSDSITIFWFRRDLRLVDNRGLFEALNSKGNVLPLFIFDTEILNKLPENDHRITFIYDSLYLIFHELQKKGRGMLIRHGKPFDVFKELINQFHIESVYCNADHEPYGQLRDDMIKKLMKSNYIPFISFIDHLVFEKNEVIKSDGTPYKVFTPYSQKWRQELELNRPWSYPSEDRLDRIVPNSFLSEMKTFPNLLHFGFERSGLSAPSAEIDDNLIRQYDATRDYPALNGTSRLGVHLRFGTISFRSLVKNAIKWNHTFVNELIWREFYAMILWHFPNVVNHSFKVVYDRIHWRNDEDDFDRWKTGTTGYPMVDAGMRQLNATGYMHNRLRMITASFLTKHLLVDWRLGEAYFAQKLFDYELSSNNGGWQWAAGTGCDAAPYFRIFNPLEQQKKFDPHNTFVHNWIPELNSLDYPRPVVDHKKARERCLKVYKDALRS
jgi:deoxyribodipyrimidine photo-lyase